MKRLIALSAVCCLTVFANASQAAYIFDDFSDSQEENSGTQLIDPLGSFTSTAMREFVTTSALGAFTNISGGDINFFSGGGSFEIRYTGFSPSPLTPSVSDLPAAVSFLLTNVSWEANDSTQQLSLQLVLNGIETSSNAVIESGTMGGTAEFLFSDFTPATLSSITSLTLQTDGGGYSGGFSASSLVVTPEPSGLILAGLGIASILTVSYIRRRKLTEITTAA